MFFFPVILLAALILIFANPIPDDSVDSDSDLYTISFDPNSDLNIEHNLVSSAFPSNEIIVANSKADVEPKCTTDSSTGIDPIDNIQKRFIECPAYPIPQAPPKIHPERPTEEPGKTTSTETNPCEKMRPNYVSCGGPEVTDARSAPILSAVLNCVPAIAVSIPAHEPFEETDIIAECCCKVFSNKGALFAAIKCRKLSDVELTQTTAQQLSAWIDQRFHNQGNSNTIQRFWEKFKKLIHTPL